MWNHCNQMEQVCIVCPVNNFANITSYESQQPRKLAMELIHHVSPLGEINEVHSLFSSMKSILCIL